ncbi:unnamed protein product, partial [Polarella glacialis]
VAVWRRLGDVVAAGYRPPDPAAPFSVRLLGASESPGPGRHASRAGPLAELYMRRPFDTSAWVYWESFWVPVGSEVHRTVFRPLLTSEVMEATAKSNPCMGPDSGQAAPTKDTGTLHSKAEAFAEIYRKGVWPGLLS